EDRLARRHRGVLAHRARQHRRSPSADLQARTAVRRSTAPFRDARAAERTLMATVEAHAPARTVSRTWRIAEPAAARVVRAVVGCAHAALAVTRAYRLLAHPGTGLAGAATVDLATTYATFIVAGSALCAIVALIAARTVRTDTVEGVWLRFVGAVLQPSARRFAALLALLAFVAATAVHFLVFDGQP